MLTWCSLLVGLGVGSEVGVALGTGVSDGLSAGTRVVSGSELQETASEERQ